MTEATPTPTAQRASALTALRLAVQREVKILEQGLERASEEPVKDDLVIKYATALANVRAQLTAVAIELEAKLRPSLAGKPTDEAASRLRRGPGNPSPTGGSQG